MEKSLAVAERGGAFIREGTRGLETAGLNATEPLLLFQGQL